MKVIINRSRPCKVLLMTFAVTFGVECLQAGTIAFYPFMEGESGSSALDKELLNSVDATKFKGTSEATYSGMSGVKFSDDVPGRFLFDGSGFKETPYVASYGSLDIWGRRNDQGGALNGTSSATVTFEDVAEELSTNSSWTIEFFHRPANAEFYAAKLIAFDAGYSIRGVSGTNVVYFVDVTSFRGTIGGNYTLGGSTLFLVNGLEDMRGTWNHFALTFDGTTMTLFHNHTKKSSATAVAGTAATHAALLLGNKGFRGKICALRISDKALAASEMLHASDNPTQVDQLVWDLPVEGVAGDAVESEHSYVDSNGVEPVYSERRKMRVVANGATVGVTSNCVHLVTASKTSSSQTFAKGPGLKVLKSSVADAMDGSFTMEGFFKLDAAEWERKVGNFVIEGASETRKRVSIMGQEWSSSGRSHLWVLAFNLSGGSYYPQIYCVYDKDGSPAAATLTSSVALAVDGKWHRYVVTYSQPTHAFVCYEDDREVLRDTLSGDLVFSSQGDWYVGAKLGNHPFEGYVDSIRLMRGVLPMSEFRAMEKIPSGMCLVIQ